MLLFLNILIYQVIWFLCVLGENRGAVLALPLLGLHLILSPHYKTDLQMMFFLLVGGLMIDGTLYSKGFFSFNVPAVPIPFWLAIIWLALATLPHNSLAWLKGRLFLSALFGGLGGPLAYWAGTRFGAASFNWPLVPSLLLLAGVWALFWMGTMSLAGRILSRSGRV